MLFFIALVAVIPFLFVMWFGSMTPDADFDVRSYHFEGPKECFQHGRITFLPHNVYTNFPFLSEMFALLGMVIEGDWYWGAVAGKSALFAFVPLTALGLFAAGRRWFSPAAGILAAVVYLTTPWIDRVTLQALAEGSLTFFLFATLFAAMMAVSRMHAGLSARRWSLVTGLLAGAAMGCKYTGLMQVVIPAAMGLVGGWWFFERRRDVAETEQSGTHTPNGEEHCWPKAASSGTPLRSLVMNLILFAAGVAITTGPWLLKNVVFTGNPVYPLAYTIFGGRDWSPALDAKFVPAHSPHDHRLADLGTKFIDVMADNDWSSPLLFALAPCALLAVRGRRVSLAVWVLVVYLIVTYWAFTHRIDRFWVPLIPAAALWPGRGPRGVVRAVDLRCRVGDWVSGLVQPGHRGGDGDLWIQRPVVGPASLASHGRAGEFLHRLHEPRCRPGRRSSAWATRKFSTRGFPSCITRSSTPPFSKRGVPLRRLRRERPSATGRSSRLPTSWRNCMPRGSRTSS